MIEWTEPAIQQLNQSYDYIALTNSEAVASHLVEHILASVQRLSTFPQSGRRGRVPETRELVTTAHLSLWLTQSKMIASWYLPCITCPTVAGGFLASQVTVCTCASLAIRFLLRQRTITLTTQANTSKNTTMK